MFINKDILALIERESCIFQTFPLFNTLVVIHAFDFLNHVLWLSNHPLRYGGEYLQMKENFVKLLNVFGKCKIRPVFVFGGISLSQRFNIRTKMRNLQRQVQRLASPLQHDPNTDFRGDSFRIPIFAKEVLIDVLNEMDILHVTCDSQSVPACAALAAYLRCPLIANSCELFLFDFEEPVGRLDRFLYIPLRYLSTTLLPHPSTADCTSLTAHIFAPSKCSLHRMPYMLRPFFAIFFKPPCGSYFPLPDRILNILKRQKDESTNNFRPMIQRARELISWLESAKSPLEVLEESVRRLEDKNAVISFVEELVNLVVFFKLDLNQGEELAKFLLPDAPASVPYRSTSPDLFTCLVQEPYPEHLKQLIRLIETEHSLASREVSDMLTVLPPYFLRLYRSGFISTVIFSRLLSNEVFLPVLEENLSRNAASDCSMGLRFLQHSMGFSFLKCHAYQIEHLEGPGQPIISEISRSNSTSHFILSTMQLRRLTPPNHIELSEMCISFIRQHTNCQLKSVNDWIQMLALTLTLWHTSKYPGAYLDILEHPTALAVSLITSAVVASGGRLTAQHLNQLAVEMPSAYNVDILHEISELQLLYISLLSLMRFVSAVSVCGSKSNLDIGAVKAPQGYQFFSSSRMIHNLAVALTESPERKSLNIWISRMLSPVENTEVTQTATFNMILLTRSLCEMRAVRPIEFVSGSETIPFPQSNNHCASHDDQNRKNEKPSHNGVVRPRHGMDVRGCQDGKFTNPSAVQRVFPSGMNSKSISGNGGFFRSNSHESGQFGPQKLNFGKDDGEGVFSSKGGLMPRNGNNSYVKWNKGSAFYSKPGFDSSNDPREKAVGGYEIAPKSRNPFLIDSKSFKPGNSFLSIGDLKVGYAASECVARTGNYCRSDVRETDEVAASECGSKLSSGLKQRLMNSRSGSLASYKNDRNRCSKSWFDSGAYGQRFIPKSPTGGRPLSSNKSDETIKQLNVHVVADTADPKNLDKPIEVKLRKNLNNANRRKQRTFQQKPSFSHFESRNPANSASRRSAFIEGFQSGPKYQSVADLQSKWNSSDLASKIDVLALDFD